MEKQSGEKDVVGFRLWINLHVCVCVCVCVCVFVFFFLSLSVDLWGWKCSEKVFSEVSHIT